MSKQLLHKGQVTTGSRRVKHSKHMGTHLLQQFVPNTAHSLSVLDTFCTMSGKGCGLSQKGCGLSKRDVAWHCAKKCCYNYWCKLNRWYYITQQYVKMRKDIINTNNKKQDLDMWAGKPLINMVINIKLVTRSDNSTIATTNQVEK